jgi:hypothetical protein
MSRQRRLGAARGGAARPLILALYHRSVFLFWAVTPHVVVKPVGGDAEGRAGGGRLSRGLR